MSELTLNIVDPGGTHGPILCDSIHLHVSDSASGKGGGSYGIRPGHTASLLSLDSGTISAFRLGKEVFAAKCGNGFAVVDRNTVTVVVEHTRAD